MPELPWGKIDIHKPDNGRLEVRLAFANIFIKVSGFFLQMSFQGLYTNDWKVHIRS